MRVGLFVDVFHHHLVGVSSLLFLGDSFSGLVEVHSN